MTSNLETATNRDKLKRVVIEPLTRVEGHGKVTLLQDEDNNIQQARLHIVEFRGFEKFIQGRPYWELPVLVQRLCGICPVSHHLVAAKAVDMLTGARQLTATAEKIRRLLHYGQVLQSHALHFFHLSSPDLLFGYDDEVRHRNIIGVINDHPDIARQGIMLRKFGQEIIEVISGKRIHGVCATPGGVVKSLDAHEIKYLSKDLPQILQWSTDAVALVKRLFESQHDYHMEFAYIESSMLSMLNSNGAFDLYDGCLRARNADGDIIFDQVDTVNYGDYIQESVKNWSYMKFPFIDSIGPENGWYRVGPLARVNNCDYFDTPLAEEQRKIFMAIGNGRPVQPSLAYHWARMIELLHCAERIQQLLNDPDISGKDLEHRGDMQNVGIGVLEAPRGTLIHHYEINDDSLVEQANLIVSTTNNNQAMNESIRQVAATYLNGNELTEPLLNQIEVAIRAYDPCLSCATHAMGKMPLEISLVNSDGALVDQVYKSGSGHVSRTSG
jgi:NAD-reducing hydrogenase large subunit